VTSFPRKDVIRQCIAEGYTDEEIVEGLERGGRSVALAATSAGVATVAGRLSDAHRTDQDGSAQGRSLHDRRMLLAYVRALRASLAEEDAAQRAAAVVLGGDMTPATPPAEPVRPTGFWWQAFVLAHRATGQAQPKEKAVAKKMGWQSEQPLRDRLRPLGIKHWCTVHALVATEPGAPLTSSQRPDLSTRRP
jgi:hypothetical protein